MSSEVPGVCSPVNTGRSASHDRKTRERRKKKLQQEVFPNPQGHVWIMNFKLAEQS
jgi:hypothetical protein